jgi:predicted transcriptional regulator
MMSLMSDKSQARRAPQEWLDRLQEGREDIAAGRVVDGEAFLAELKAEDGALQKDLATQKKARN